MRLARTALWHARLADFYEMGGGNNSQRHLAMEGLRGLAVLLVFFVHYHALFQTWVRPESLTFRFSYFLGNIGHSGVDLFFVLSGYLIYGAVIRKYTNFTAFIKRRAQRIYPTFLCVLVIYLLLSAVYPELSKIPTEPSSAAIYILQNLLLLPGIFPITPVITVAWSLSYEFFFYLMLPLLVATLRMRRWESFHRVIFFLTLAVLYTAYCLLTNQYMHFRMIMFISGILLYEARHSYNLVREMTPHAECMALLALLVTFPLIYTLPERPDLLPAWLDAYRFGGVYREFVLFISFFAFTLACANSRGLVRSIFSWTPLRWLGNMSYSYYLIHGLALRGVAFLVMRVIAPDHHAPLAFWLGMPVFFFVTLVVSTILFLLVEKRFSLAPAAPQVNIGETVLRGGSAATE